MPSGQVRPVNLSEDERAIISFLHRRSGNKGLATLSESKLVGLKGGSTSLVAREQGEIIGLAVMVRAAGQGEWAMEIVAEPHRSVEAALVEAAERGVEASSGSVLRWWIYDDLDRVALDLGYQPERLLLLMGRPLPTSDMPRFDPQVVVRPFRPGEDDDAWLAVNNAAFEGHPENGGWGQADLEQRLEAGWFDSEGFLTAWVEDELVGFCWTKIHPDQRGEIYVIGVSPPWWGRGLGRALVLEGMRYLTGAGCRRVFLYTEGDNARAVRLYRDLGFAIERNHRSFVKQLDRSVPAGS